MRLGVSPGACIAAGFVAQIHGQHVPRLVSGVMIGGGMAWAVVREAREERRLERLDEYDRSLVIHDDLTSER